MKNLLIIAGPTAVGKTEISIKLAKEINGEIISCDSMQIYKDMDIGSAKISKDQMPQELTAEMIEEMGISPLEAVELKDSLIDIKNEKSLELRTNIREFAEQNPEISAQLLKSWLKGDGSNE